ncbi:MAG: hypothetical protein RR954_06125 [Christensenellaceae bacterium]
MKANTNSDGILMAALNEDDVQRVVELRFAATPLKTVWSLI